MKMKKKKKKRKKKSLTGRFGKKKGNTNGDCWIGKCRDAAVLGSPGPLALSMIRTIVSQLTDPKEQGSVFAGLGTVEALCGMTSSAMLNAIYANTLSWMKGFVFIVDTLFFIIPVVLLLILHYINKKEKAKEAKEEYELDNEENSKNITTEVEPVECQIVNSVFNPDENVA